LEEYKKLFKAIPVPSFTLLLLLISSIIIKYTLYSPAMGNLFPAVTVLILAAFTIFTVIKNSVTKKNIIPLIIAGVCIILYADYRISSLMPENSDKTLKGPFKASIQSTSQKRYNSLVILKIHKKGKNNNSPCTAAAFLPNDISVKKGDTVAFDAKIKHLSLSDKKLSGYSLSLARKGICLITYPNKKNFRIINKKEKSLKTAIKSSIIRNIDSAFSAKTGRILKALYFGNKNFIDKSTISDFKEAGVLHVLAASGLHVGIIASIPLLLLSLLRLNKNIIISITLVILFAYLYLTDIPVSLLRACIMFGIYAVQRIFYLDKNIFNTLFLTAIVILLLYPYEIFNAGFQLSFGATLGILLFYNFYKKSFSYINNIVASPLALTLSAQVIVIPVIAVHMKELNLAGIISNIIVVPLIAAGLVTSIAASFLAYFSTAASGLAGYMTNLIFDLSRYIVNSICLLNGHFHLETISLLLIISFILMLVPLVPFIRNRKILSISLAAAFILAWLPLSSYRDNDQSNLVLFSSKKSNAALYIHNRPNVTLNTVRNPETMHIMNASLIGDISDFKTAKKIAEYISKSGISRIDMYVKKPDFINVSAFSYITRKCTVNRCFLSSGFRLTDFTQSFFRILEKDEIKLKIHSFALNKQFKWHKTNMDYADIKSGDFKNIEYIFHNYTKKQNSTHQNIPGLKPVKICI